VINVTNIFFINALIKSCYMFIKKTLNSRRKAIKQSYIYTVNDKYFKISYQLQLQQS
jgi:hypothetical protein